jgi:hypothetical protein
MLSTPLALMLVHALRAASATSVTVWWKPTSAATAISDVADMRSQLSATATIIYCGLAFGKNGTLAVEPASHEPGWGYWSLCEPAVAAAGAAGLDVQIIVEGRFAEVGSPVAHVVDRGGAHFGSQILARVRSLRSHAFVTGINLDVERSHSQLQTNLTQEAFDNFTAALAEIISPAGLRLTSCVGFALTEHDLARARRVGRVSSLFAMNLYHATSGREWEDKLAETLHASGPAPTGALVAGFSLPPKYAYENTSASVGERFAALHRHGVQHIALFAYTEASAAKGYGLPDDVVAEWVNELGTYTYRSATVDWEAAHPIGRTVRGARQQSGPRETQQTPDLD